jgi:hypothetical protein
MITTEVHALLSSPTFIYAFIYFCGAAGGIWCLTHTEYVPYHRAPRPARESLILKLMSFLCSRIPHDNSPHVSYAPLGCDISDFAYLFMTLTV